MAFILTQEAMLAAAPVVLPLVALYASRQRERLAAAAESEAQLARLEALLIELQGEAADEVAAEVGEEVAELLRAAQAAAARQSSGGGAAAAAEAQRLLAALEAKLSAVEGSVLSTGGRLDQLLGAAGCCNCVHPAAPTSGGVLPGCAGRACMKGACPRTALQACGRIAAAQDRRSSWRPAPRRLRTRYHRAVTNPAARRLCRQHDARGA